MSRYKLCSLCQHLKPPSHFLRKFDSVDGRGSVCFSCRTDWTEELVAARKTKRRQDPVLVDPSITISLVHVFEEIDRNFPRPS